MQWLRLHDMGFRLEVELERVEPEGEWEGNCNSSCVRKKNKRQGSYTAGLTSHYSLVTTNTKLCSVLLVRGYIKTRNGMERMKCTEQYIFFTGTKI